MFSLTKDAWLTTVWAAARTTLPARPAAFASASSSAGPRDDGSLKRMSRPIAAGWPARKASSSRP